MAYWCTGEEIKGRSVLCQVFKSAGHSALFTIKQPLTSDVALFSAVPQFGVQGFFLVTKKMQNSVSEMFCSNETISLIWVLYCVCSSLKTEESPFPGFSLLCLRMSAIKR